MARLISRPSLAVVTLQELLRRYFAISDRVSRSSSTTRMFGGTGAITNPLPDNTDNGVTFLFPYISVLADVTPCNMSAFARWARLPERCPRNLEAIPLARRRQRKFLQKAHVRYRYPPDRPDRTNGITGGAAWT